MSNEMLMYHAAHIIPLLVHCEEVVKSPPCTNSHLFLAIAFAFSFYYLIPLQHHPKLLPGFIWERWPPSIHIRGPNILSLIELSTQHPRNDSP